MGCDIHAHVEVKIGGKWEHYSCPDIDRDYGLFTRMAGVRSYNEGIIPISEPKGLPVDVNFLTKIESDSDGCDGHSHSWLSRAEAGLIEKEFNDSVFGYPFGWCLSEVIEEELGPKCLEDLRVVFWFDN